LTCRARALGSRPITRFRPSAAAAIVAACLLVATALAAWFGARQVGQRADDALTERAASLASTIDRRVDTYLEKTYGLRGLFLTRRPTRTEFETYMAGQRVRERFPGALSLGIAEVTTLEDRDAFTRRVGRDADRSGLPYPPFTIRPNAAQPLSVVVDYTHPVDGLQRAFGFDLLSESGRRKAVTRARDLARPASTAPLALVTEEGDEQGVLVMLPMYAGASQTPPALERSRRFRGVAYAALRLPDLMSGIATGPGDDLEIYDVGSVDDPLPARLRAGSQAFDLRGGPDAPDRNEDRSRVLPLAVAGRRWQVYFRPGTELVSSTERAIPWLIAGLGLIVSLLAGAVVQALSTATRRAEALADQMTEELQRSNEELERFAFLASHDLQMPLRTVSGFLQLLEHQAGDRLNERDHEYIGQAQKGTKQMAGLIDDLLAYSRVGREERPLRPVPLDDAWDSAVEQLKATIDGADAQVSRAELPVVTGDPGQLVQVFTNLIGNAVKYRSEHVPAVHAEARLVNGVWEVAVADNGVGIPPEHQDRIFEMFRRLHTEEEVEGTGVGLALVKRIVERAGGTVRVESSPGQGSTFVLSLKPADRRPR